MEATEDIEDCLRQLKFKLNDDIAEHISVADAQARRWLIPSPQPDTTDQEQLEELEGRKS